MQTFGSEINDGTKYVLSKTIKKSNWKNSVFIKNLADIKRLKNSKGSKIQVGAEVNSFNCYLRMI